MSKNKGHPPPKIQGSVRIELEDNAEEIFLASLNELTPQQISKEKLEASPLSPKRVKPQSHRHSQEISIDLHGFTIEGAKKFVHQRIISLLAQHRAPFTLNIITGKGLHSPERKGVLAEEIHHYVKKHFQAQIIQIDDSPAAVTYDNLPIRGHFKVTLNPQKERFHHDPP